MARLRRGEGHENMSQPLPPVPEASVEELSERENSESPTFPSYLTLELDVSDFQAFMPETDAASTQPDWEMDGCQDLEVAERLSLLARLETPGSVGQNPRYVTRTRPRKEERHKHRTAGCLDSQSVKTTEVGGADRGFDNGKKVKGRRCDVLVDTWDYY